MITLNDYLYSGDTVMRILKKYKRDLGRDAALTGNEIDMIHCDFLQSIIDLLEHNEFLTAQSQKIREFYMYMARQYPWLAFTFKGRIKSLIRAEEKFNGYIVKDIYKYYVANGTYPPVEELRKRLETYRANGAAWIAALPLKTRMGYELFSMSPGLYAKMLQKMQETS